MIEAVRDRLPDIDRDRQHRQARSSATISALLREEGVSSTSISLYARPRRARRLGAAGAAADGLDLGHLEHQPLGDQAHAVRLGERDARVEQHVDGEGAFVEWRQKVRGRRNPALAATTTMKATAVSSSAECPNARSSRARFQRLSTRTSGSVLAQPLSRGRIR
jgi:hypothetical protein